jgi:hypothetical protein
MLHYVNDSKLGCIVEVKAVNRQAILDATKIIAKPGKRKFFIENFTQTPDFNAASHITKDRFTPNIDNQIYYPWNKEFDIPNHYAHECDWTTFINYR